MSSTARLIPIYTSRGDVAGFMVYPYIYSAHGDWIGWVKPDRSVYSVHGHYVGELTKDPRIIRRREFTYDQTRQSPPPTPAPIHPPAQVPLAPQMPQLPSNMIDVLEEAPHILPPIDFGELRGDME